MRAVISNLYRGYHKTNTTSVFISSMVMIFIFGFAKKYLQGKKLGHFEIRGPLFPDTTFFSNCVFPSQNLNKKIFYFPNSCRSTYTSLSLRLVGRSFPGSRPKFPRNRFCFENRKIGEFQELNFFVVKKSRIF